MSADVITATGFVIFPGLTLLFSYFRRVYGAAFLLAVLPVYQMRAEVFGIPVTVLEISLLLFVLFVGGTFIVRKEKPRWGEAQLLVVLFLATATAGVLISPNTQEALGIWKAYFLEPIAFFLVLVNIIRHSRDIRLLYLGLGIGVVVIGLVSFWQAIDLLPAALPYAEEVPPRLSSVFSFPNAVALLTVPVTLLFMPFFLSHLAARRASVFIYGGVFFGLFALLLSVSEAGFLGFFAGVIALLLLERRWRFLLAMLIIVAAVVLGVPSVRHEVSALATFSDTSTDVRLRVWEGSVRLLVHNPITGAGLAGFPDAYDRYRDAAHVELLLYPHSFVLNFWSELGLAGLLTVLALLVQFFRRVGRRMSGHLEPYRMGILAAMVGLLVHGFFDVPYFKNDLALLFWTLLALAVILETFHHNEQPA